MPKPPNHVAVAVPDPGTAASLYVGALRAKVSAPVDLAKQGVRVGFVDLGDSKVEWPDVFGKASPIEGLPKTNPTGGMHPIRYEVADILAARDALVEACTRVPGPGEPKIGAHSCPVLFLHPADLSGTLVELEEV